MKVAIRWDLCLGAGRCIAASDGAFDTTAVEWGVRALLVAADRPAEAYLAAARACPTLAIRLVDDQGQLLYPPPDLA